MDLTKYVTDRQVTSLLLMGNPGLSMKEDGLALARHLLTTKTLKNHPDFLLIAPEENKKSIGVDEIQPVLSLGAYPPVYGKYAVVLIDGMEKLTLSAQNKLLVLLESNPYVFIIGVCNGTVLETVKSRMRIVPYRSCTKEEFFAICGLPAEESELLFYATTGSPDVIAGLKKEKDMFLAIKRACSKDAERQDLYRILHLLKEKDKQTVTEDARLMLYVFRVLQFIFKERARFSQQNNDLNAAVRYLDIISRLIQDEKQLTQSNYSKNDFFFTIMYCVEH